MDQDPDGRRLPIKLDAASNGEYEPVPLTRAALTARADAHDAVTVAARRVGLPRRRYLVSLLGAAASLAAIDSAFARAGLRGGGYVLPPEAAYEPAASKSSGLSAAAPGTCESTPIAVSLSRKTSLSSWSADRHSR